MFTMVPHGPNIRARHTGLEGRTAKDKARIESVLASECKARSA
jgi:hypothetical protein